MVNLTPWKITLIVLVTESFVILASDWVIGSIVWLISCTKLCHSRNFVHSGGFVTNKSLVEGIRTVLFGKT